MKKKPKKSADPLAGKEKYFTDGKRNPFKKRMTGAGRAMKLRFLKKAANEKLAGALGLKGMASEPEVLEIAAARLNSIGEGNHILDFDFAAHSYLSRIKWEPGNLISIDNFWGHFQELVEKSDLDLAKTFAVTRDFRNYFMWCMAGHIHRLKAEYDKQPSSVETIEIYKRGKTRTTVALCNGL